MIEVLLVLWALIKSPLLGLGVLIYILDSRKKYNNLLKMARTDINEFIEKCNNANKKEQNTFEKLKKVTPLTAQKFETYKECSIEDHLLYFDVILPTGEKLNQSFSSIEDAKKEIDGFELQPTRYKRQRIHNIRFVR